MDVVFGVILVIIFLFIVMGPMLQRMFGPMLQRWMMGKMEDRFRRMAGMPTRKEEKKARKQAERRQRQGAERFRRAAGGRRASAASAARGRSSSVEMLQAFAEDVEFTEIKEYSAEVKIGKDSASATETYTVEEQVEDAEYVEVKTERK